MEEKIKVLLSYLYDRKEYFHRFVDYERKFNNTKASDALYARTEEIDFIIRELQRIVNDRVSPFPDNSNITSKVR